MQKQIKFSERVSYSVFNSQSAGNLRLLLSMYLFFLDVIFYTHTKIQNKNDPNFSETDKRMGDKEPTSRCHFHMGSFTDVTECVCIK